MDKLSHLTVRLEINLFVLGAQLISWIDVGSTSQHRSLLLEKVLDRKKSGKFRVLDLGGGVNGWASEIRDYSVDLVEGGERSIVGDLFSETTWETIRSLGRFDLVILSHILEDVRDPFYILRKTSEISDHVFISVPSKFVEFFPVESHAFVGHHHHRWVFGSSGSSLTIEPKTAAANIFLKRGFVSGLRGLLSAFFARIGVYGSDKIFAGGYLRWLRLMGSVRYRGRHTDKNFSLSLWSSTPVPITTTDYIVSGDLLARTYANLMDLRF